MAKEASWKPLVVTSPGGDTLDDRELLRQFEECTLPFDQWTHRTHVKVAFLYLRKSPFDEALTKIRTGIKAYNATNNVPEGPMTGYNETTTHALMSLIHTTMQAYSATFATPDADTFCDTHPQLMNKHVLRLFYSPARRALPAAKTRFVAPDLSPLPNIERAHSPPDRPAELD